MMDDTAPIALVVIGGYLGAGKTTLLNRVLSNAGQRKIAVLVNDFGAINIDASLIRERSDDVINLENGCICCSIGGRLVDALVKIGQRDARPELLVIEASGVSDPVKIAQIGLLDRAFRLYGIVVAVDAQRLEETLADPYVGDIAQRQIEGATALVLTKVDLSGAEKKHAAQHMLAKLNPAAVQFESGGEPTEPLPLETIFDPPRDATAFAARKRDGASLLQRAEGQTHHDINSMAWRSDFRIDRKRLKSAFRGLQVPLLRAKGIVWIEHQALPHELHVVGGRVVLTPFEGHAPPESTIVLIGRLNDDDARTVTRCLDGTCVR